MAFLHTTKKQEGEIRKLGFEFPEFPKQGDILLDGKRVGFADNFAGLHITDKGAIDLLIANENRLNLAIWNRNEFNTAC